MKQKRTKKWIALAAAGILACSLCVPALADEQYSKVTWTKSGDYTVTIPETIELNENAAVEQEIKAVYNLEPGKELTIAVKADSLTDSKVTLKEKKDNSVTVTSLVQNDGKDIGTDVFVTLGGVQDTQETVATLTYGVPQPTSGSVLQAGEYEGTMTFVISTTTQGS